MAKLPYHKLLPFRDMLVGAFGGGDEEEERNEDGELVSVVEARKEAEDKRMEKHRQQEAEREEIRQGIRDKACKISALILWCLMIMICREHEM